jgi:polyhydroxyalkanoate synthase
MVKKGYTVFSLSWVNPDASFSNKTFSDYVLDGPVAAIKVIKNLTGISEINIAGYCIGGTLVACALAYLSARNDHSVKSVTYLTTMLDFQNFGFFTDFVDKDYVKKIDKIMKKQGYLDGYFLHQLFNFLRPKDLVWPYYIKNYLQGESPGENDLLFWNSDYANLPPKVIDYCLNNFVIKNELIKPKHLFIGKTPIDLSSIKIPAYFFSTIRDHLTPWKSTYAGLRTHSGDCVFILGDSGHIAGVVNPPTKKKYGYFINAGAHNTPDEFLEKAKKISGSWWPHWEKWLKPQSGKKIKARQPGSDQYPVIEDAPGSYVKVQYVRANVKMTSPKTKK